MIIASIKDCEKYFSVNEGFKKAFEWLKNCKPEEMPKTEIDGEKVWGRVFIDKTLEDSKPYEAHRKYIDIHYMLKGSEEFGYIGIEKTESVKEYDEVKDVERLAGEMRDIVLEEGFFCITFPEDCHLPSHKVIGGETAVRAMAKVIV